MIARSSPAAAARHGARLGVDVRRRRRRVGPRALLRRRGAPSSTSRCDLGVDRVELRSRPRSLASNAVAQPLDRAARLPLLDLLARAVGEVAHALGVRPRAVGLALEQRRPAARAGPRDRLAGRRVDRPARRCRRPRRRACRRPRRAPPTLGLPAAYANGTSVANWLFSQTNSTGSFQMRGQVQPFVERAVVDRPVAEERDRDAVRLQQLEAVARPGRLQDARADDAARAHHADFRREQVHAAAAAARAAGRPAEQLGDQLARRHALGQRVAVPAVRAEDDVVAAAGGRRRRRRSPPGRRRCGTPRGRGRAGATAPAAPRTGG